MKISCIALFLIIIVSLISSIISIYITYNGEEFPDTFFGMMLLLWLLLSYLPVTLPLCVSSLSVLLVIISTLVSYCAV